jgi:type VI secretion system protein
MPKERLLERIRRIEANPNYRGLTNSAQVVESILRHLQKVLNTRQGNALIGGDYGMPDFTDLVMAFSSGAVKDLARSISRVIQKFEPRLSGIKVRVDPRQSDSSELHFRIAGKLTMEDDVYVPVTFATVVDPDGRITVSQ